MNKLTRNNSLFTELVKQKPTWWLNLVNDENIYIDIRKDNYIDVYYNGGNIIRELRFKNGKFNGSINYKYLVPVKSEYINYDFDNQSIGLQQSQINLLDVNNFDSASLKLITNNISTHYPASSEKGIQARFIKNANCFLDTEMAYNDGNSLLRIDLVWIDTSNKKIVFVELKTMGDSRVYTTELRDQLKKYHDFAVKYEQEIIGYYTKVFEIKKMLGILPKGLKELDSISDYNLELKPLLLFGDCQQAWINSNANDVNKRIKDVAVGAYYFGSTDRNCDLISKSSRNRFIF
ncbi:hypothetical protein [Carboxylicivirga sp. RSCT41]|uniref:hypothetical protein n=1 Tax=Carboxylicivirga agarovorans TaxID=3417570 RepID=UPI003D336EF8